MSRQRKPRSLRSINSESRWLLTGFYVEKFVGLWILVTILAYFWGEYVLLDFSDLRAQGTSMPEGLTKVWWIFAWGLVVTLALGIWHRKKPRPAEPGEALVDGWWTSLNAGFFEELIWRWLLFFGAMIGIPFLNFITFGLVGWLYREISVPLANWATLGALEPQLLGHESWVFGAAIVSASISFRDAHNHLGLLGWVNAWFFGMVMFWLVFHYGIGTAIVAHIVYDVIVFSTAALTYTWRPRNYLADILQHLFGDAAR